MYKMNLSISLGSKKITFRIEILILIVLVVFIISTFTLGSTCKIGYVEGINMINAGVHAVKNKVREGFAANNGAFSTQFSKFNSPPINTTTWSMPNLTFSPGQKPSKGVQAIWDRKPQPIPLPKGELDFFQTTEFKPDCCPNAYSNSMGCACMTVDQYNYLVDRGGNNVPYSEY